MKTKKSLTVISVNISEKKGVIKSPVPEIRITENGIAADAHSGPWNRQISLLGIESVNRFEKELGRTIIPGEFAENITTEGMELFHAKPLDHFTIGDVVLEVTQIGKHCHGDNCAIFREVGNCVMPKEGIFCRVVKTGVVKPGDPIEYQRKIVYILVITLSDRASQGIYEDKSGPAAARMMEEYFTSQDQLYCIKTMVLPDHPYRLREALLRAKGNKVDIIITTGGTGIGPKDFTPEVVRPLLTKEIPGIMDHIRLKYGQDKPQALISRSIAGVMDQSLIFALPGSVKGVQEYITELKGSFKHMMYMINGLDIH